MWPKVENIKIILSPFSFNLKIGFNVEKIINIIVSKHLEYEVDLKPTSSLIYDLGMDSFSLFFIASELKEQFGIDITETEITIGNFGTIDNIIEFVKEKIKNV